MSFDLERQIQEYLFFGGPYPNLAEGITDVPMPITAAKPVPVFIKHMPGSFTIPVRHGDKATLHDYQVGLNKYVDEDGHPISKAEAQAEVDYQNGKR